MEEDPAVNRRLRRDRIGCALATEKETAINGAGKHGVEILSHSRGPRDRPAFLQPVRRKLPTQFNEPAATVQQDGFRHAVHEMQSAMYHEVA